MARAITYLVRQYEAFAVETLRTGRLLAVHSVVRPGRLRWTGEAISGIRFGWHNLKREMRPLKIRWGWALLIAVILLLLLGELGPAASALARLP
jgi:hypothetical protein